MKSIIIAVLLGLSCLMTFNFMPTLSFAATANKPGLETFNKDQDQKKKVCRRYWYDSKQEKMISKQIVCKK